MARIQIPVRSSLKRKFALVAGSASHVPEKKAAGVHDGGLRCLVGKSRAASGAPAGAGEGCHDLGSGGKVPSSAGARRGDYACGLTATVKAASQGSKPTSIRNLWETSSQSLVTVKTNGAFPASLRVVEGSRYRLTSEGEYSSFPAAGGASQHKYKNVMPFRKLEAASPRLMAKASVTSSACMPKTPVQSIAKANPRPAAGPLVFVKTLSPNKAQKRVFSPTFEEPRRPSLQKKAKFNPPDARRRVQERLSKFRSLAMEYQRHKEQKADMKAFKDMKARYEVPNRKYLGQVPGVEVGDEFYYRAELMVAGLHGSPIAGIDSMPFRGAKVATCVVSSKGYDNIMEGSDVLVYSGEGGNPCFESARKRPPGDQRLEGANLALKNSMDAQTPVRVVHGFRVPRGGGETLDSRAKTAAKYVYDGLYLVENFWWEDGKKGFRVLRFQMRRLPGQPKLDLKQVWRARPAAPRIAAKFAG